MVTFLDRRGSRLGLSFVPIRTDELLDTLGETGWPVRVERVGFGGRRDEDETEPAASATPAAWAPVLPWAIACTPLIGVVFGIITAATHSAGFGRLAPPVSVVPMWLLSLVLAVVDVRQLRAAGRNAPQQEYALFGPCVYLLARAFRSRGATRKAGWPPFVVAVVMTILTVITTELALNTTAGSSNSHRRAAVAQVITRDPGFRCCRAGRAGRE
jgi:hypothetical protein